MAFADMAFADARAALDAPAFLGQLWDAGSVLTSLARNDTGNVTAQAYLSDKFATYYIPAAAAAGLLFALYQVALVSGVRVHSMLLDEDDSEALLGPAGEHDGARCARAARERAGAALRARAAVRMEVAMRLGGR